MKRLEWAAQVGERTGSLINVTDRLAQALGAVATEHTRTAIARAESGAQALTLLLACPSLCAANSHLQPDQRCTEHASHEPRRFLRQSVNGLGTLVGTAALGGTLLTTRMAFGAPNTPNDGRFVFIILRGALDGLSAVPPKGIPRTPRCADLWRYLPLTITGED